MASPGYDPAPLGGEDPQSLSQAASRTWVRRIVEVVNGVLGGKLNAVASVTLAASAATTTVTDARISPFSFIGFSPLTANAAAEIGNGTLYVSAQTSGSCTLTHANNAQTDRNLTLLIVS